MLLHSQVLLKTVEIGFLTLTYKLIRKLILFIYAQTVFVYVCILKH